MKEKQSRRGFLIGAGAVAASAAGGFLVSREGLGGDAGSAPPVTDPDAVREAAQARYRVLGKTGLRVSAVGIGAASLRSPAVLDRALDLGLNYIDTAACYGDGASETAVGTVMAKRRGEVVLTTKWHPGPKARSAEMLRSLEGSLKRLQTDHVDCVLIHSVRDPARLENPEVLEAFEVARKAGKVRFLGFSSHSPTLPEVVRAGIKVGCYDVVLLKYSYMSFPRLKGVFDEIHRAGIGITVMKTRDGARYVDLAEFQRGDGFVGAALRWASSNPQIGSAVITMKTFDDADLYAQVAGQELAAVDTELLERYAGQFDQVQCRWCGECGSSCPQSVPVWDVDRAVMYHDRYGEERRGMALYSALGNPAAACVTCPAPCESACSYQIPIGAQMRDAHARLSWDPDGPVEV
jgi:predicted aldo/keto reductase-like oxidoreductase